MAGLSRSGFPASLIFSDRDFTASDYEVLCSLDDAVDKRQAATRAEIDALPVSVFRPSSGGGLDVPRCVICLEDFELGVSLRHLPCSHFGHLDCIDRWLAMKAVCPICQHLCTLR